MRNVFLGVACVLSASWLGCSSSPPPPAEQPDPTRDEASPPPAEPAPRAEPTPRDEPTDEGSAAAPATAAKDTSVPDDYTIVHGDCVQLGKQFAAVTRADQLAALSPRLSAEQRADTEKKVDTVTAKLGERYMQTCDKNIGRSIDPKALKCAFDARSVKAFEQCLDGPAPAK